MWSFQGKILKRVNLEKFAQLLWRPRCPTLLDEKQLKEIKKNLKKYYAQFESKDRMRQTKASKELIEKRSALMEKFNAYRHKRIKEWNEQKPRRLELRNGMHSFINMISLIICCSDKKLLLQLYAQGRLKKHLKVDQTVSPVINSLGRQNATEIPNLLFCSYFPIIITFFVLGIDTDELDSDSKNVEEEIVEFFIKEEVTVIE